MGYVQFSDTLYTTGMITYDPDDPLRVQFRKGRDPLQVFTADEVSEFGFRKGPIFRPFLIDYDGRRQRVFLEVLADGNLVLLALPGRNETMFLTTDSVFTTLEDNNYAQILSQWTGNCDRLDEQYRLVRNNRRAISNFVRLYNQQECRNLPFINYGVSISYDIQTAFLESGALIDQNVFAVDGLPGMGRSAGLFFEHPFWQSYHFSLLGDIRFRQSSFQEESLSASVNQDVKFSRSDLQLQFGGKYAFNSVRFRPYLWLGAAASYTLSAETELFQANFEDQTIYLETTRDFTAIPDLYLGLAGGMGFRFFYRYDHFVGVELRGQRLISDGSSSFSGLALTLNANL